MKNIRVRRPRLLPILTILMKGHIMSNRTKKERKERKEDFKTYRQKGGKLNNRGNRIGLGKNIKG